VRRSAPSAERNKGPILDVLKRVFVEFSAPDPRRPAFTEVQADAASAARRARGLVLEIASGTGQHTAHFAQALPAHEFQPTEADSEMLPSIAALCEELPNVRAPFTFDIALLPWPVERADAILCINMIHIAPWQATLDLMKGAGRTLDDGGVLVLYGPYRRGGAHTAPSNEAFDADLRSRNPAWGIRDLEKVAEVASSHGLALEEAVAMPANNFTVVFRKP
jgi:SAM-dependent methyltransferase